ncbi:hypothetical protein [Pseudarthrobacter sp. LT1]|uniref:hypothetical protein n=1 Tax=Pseudarthrobacter sp. LT1 TaxID=3111450 RepID=UPI002D7691A8|nr:hypothetical protein [Pseudarthrobacter sp. LT1]WRT14651.1 hypothetical protein VIK36_03925 [Pseudarthrobacter sp. LT1]
MTETDRAQNLAGAAQYGVYGPGDFKVTAHPSIPYAVLVKQGRAHGYGVTDEAEIDQVVQCATIASGTRWDLIVVRRNWQPALGGPSTLEVIQAGADPIIPATRKIGPGVEDDQPLFLVKWQGGTSAPVEFIDLRVWAGNGGLYAKSELVRTYLTDVGTEVNISGAKWVYKLGVNDMAGWERIPPFHIELTTAANTAGPNTIWGLGTFSVDSPKSTDLTLAAPNGTDLIKVRDAGLYAVTVLLSFTKPISGVSWGSVDGAYTTALGGGLQNFVVPMPNIMLTAGQVINPTLAHGSGPDDTGTSNRTFTSRVRITRIG